MSSDAKFFTGVGVAVAVVIGAVGFGMWGIPQYRVYSQNLRGQAALAEASSTRRVAVEEAMALKDSAKHRADAEIIRARGVAEANVIIGDSLQGNEAYLRYLYIDAMKETPGQTIYIPTEAGMPIMEANRFRNSK